MDILPCNQTPAAFREKAAELPDGESIRAFYYIRCVRLAPQRAVAAPAALLRFLFAGSLKILPWPLPLLRSL